MKAKSIFASKTFWFAIGTFWAAALPTMQGCANENRPPNSVEILGLITAAITTGGAVYGRYAANSEVYTPEGLPGRDKVEAANS